MKLKTIFGIILAAVLFASCNVTPKVSPNQSSDIQTTALKAEPTESVLSDDIILRDEFEMISTRIGV